METNTQLLTEAPPAPTVAKTVKGAKRKRRRRVWGSGSVWQRDGRWWITWRERGRRRSKSFLTEDLARRVLAKITVDIAAGKCGLPNDPRNAPTLEELARPWFEARKRTHRACGDDLSRWRTNLSPYFGKMRPGEVDGAAIRGFVEKTLAKGLAANTVGNCVRLLSALFTYLVETKHVAVNPVSVLPRSTRRLFRSTHDPKATPFLERPDDVRRVFLALPEPINIAFAVGALAGLRTGEVLALAWPDIDLAGRRIRIWRQVQDGQLTPLKDEEPRVILLQNALAPILAEYKLATGGEGYLFTPTFPTRGGRPDLGTPPGFIRPHTLLRHLRIALKKCGLPCMTWYECTRHTFASLFVLGGGSLEVLRDLMGHSSVTTTERYSHLKPDLFAEKNYTAIEVDLSKPAGDVVALRPAENSCKMTTMQQDSTQQQLAKVS